MYELKASPHVRTGSTPSEPVAVVLPTLNEVEGLRRTLDDIPVEALRAAGWPIRLLVIDGGSTDRTLEVAAERGVEILHQKSRGKGAAVREAFEYLRSQGVRYAVVLDADCTYPGDAVAPAIALLSTGVQLVVGVRRPAWGRASTLRESIHRIGNYILNYTASQLSHHSILDLCSGFYAVDLSTRIDEALEATGFDVEAELFLRSYQRGLRAVQFPIEYRRRVGEAKLRAFQDGFRIFLRILRVGPTRVSTPVGRETAPASLVRDLLAVCLVHGADDLVVVTPASRYAEALTISRSLRGSGIHSEIVLSPIGAPPGSVQATEESAGAPEATRPTLTLPHVGDSPGPDRTRAMVLLPRTNRIVFVGDDPSFARSGARLGLQASPIRTEIPEELTRAVEASRLWPTRWGGRMRAQLASSPEGKELALLEANDLRSSVPYLKQPPA